MIRVIAEFAAEGQADYLPYATTLLFNAVTPELGVTETR